MDVLKQAPRVLVKFGAGLALAGFMAMATPAASAQGIIRDAEIEAILREYSNPLFEAAGLKASDVDIMLIQDPSLNAFVSDGQKVHLHTGLIMATDTPEELKGVIAHETGHIAGGDMVRLEGAMQAGQGAALISMGLGVLALAAGAPDAGMALIGSAPQFGMLTIFKYTRIQESGADQIGLQIMDKTNQSAMGLVDFMEKFRYEEQMSAARQDPYFRSHPVSSDRISVMRSRAMEISARAKPQTDRAKQQLAIMKAKLVGFIGPPTRVYSKYPKTDMSEPAQYARAIAEYRAVDIKTALNDTQKLIDDHPENPYYRELYGQILFESGKIDESIEHHRKSVELAPDQPLLKINLARSLIESKDPKNVKEGEGVLRDALTVDQDNPFAWNQLASAYGKLGKVGDADLATAEEAYYLGDMSRAQNFARRASMKLEPGTPNAQRASDIGALTDPRVLRAQRRG